MTLLRWGIGLLLTIDGLFMVIAWVPPAQGTIIWVEGEYPSDSHVKRHSWYDAVRKHGMSGGDWISHYDTKPGSVTYRFNSPDTGEFTFWWRGNPFHARVSYNLNAAGPLEIDFAHDDIRDQQMISPTPDHRYLAWVNVGKVHLKKGPNTITFVFHSDIGNHGGIDCFCFTALPFTPSGAEKPSIVSAAVD